MVRKDNALALITEIEHMEMGKRTNPPSHVGRAHGEDQKAVGIKISGNTGKNLELHAGSR